MEKVEKILISGGGTGGHIYPALAIANELKRLYPNAKFLFVGAQDKMEMEKVPQAGYPIKGLWISGLQRKQWLKNLLFPVKIFHSLWRSRKIVTSFKPDIAVGTGGFASGPALYMAAVKNIPILVQEQNSYAGITNKLLAKKANKICVAYENLDSFFPSSKIVVTGNPVRQDLLDVASKRVEGLTHFKLDATKKTLLVLGGSLGARAINQIMAKNWEALVAQNLQIIWQTGSFYEKAYQGYNNKLGVQTHAYLAQMDLAYAAADVIVSRAGASSVSELCIVGKPVLFIPSPNVAEDHQTKNAEAIVNKNAALLLKETEQNQFLEKLLSLVQNQEKILELSQNIKSLAKPEATRSIVKEIEKLTEWS